jgi:predicted O-methyltransferase YrrM
MLPSRLCPTCDWRFFNVPAWLPCPKCGTPSGMAARQAKPPSHWPPLHQYPSNHAADWCEVDARVFYDEWCLGIPTYDCSCAANWAEYTKSSPPDFSSADAFFNWSVEAHNYVSVNHAQPRKLPMAVADARKLYACLEPCETYYRPVPADLSLIPEVPKDTLVITVATGEQYERMMLNVTGPYMHQYAQRIGADFLALTGVTQVWWGLEKFRVGPIAAKYKRTLFVDADILIRSDAPNIFDTVPEGSIGMCNDWAVQGDHGWHRIEREKLWESQGVPPLYPEYMRNSGVIVVDDIHADIWTPPLHPVPGNHVDEQFWVERWTRFYDFYELPMRWNTQWYYPDFRHTRDAAYFLHFACCPHDRRMVELQSEIAAGNTCATTVPAVPTSWSDFKDSPLVSQYPQAKFPIREDLTGWSTPECLAELSRLVADLAPGKIVLELGSFVGAVSTQAILRADPDVRVVCVDKFATSPDMVSVRPLGDTPFLLGEGSQWEHFANNTWHDQHRIAAMQADASPYTLKLIHKAKLDIGLVFVDADHAEHPVYAELVAITQLWPSATIVLDDYSDDFPGIIRAVKRAREDSVFAEGDSFNVVDNRIMVIRRAKQ